ncbi:DUF6065 family protein [Nonomuraea sp. NPDC050556]|uniref:DUF6065 family protein n=1 Tax=Nonomuraea sp. NPDC050556 TaxID=3364369 RepID=UPI003793220E
MTKSPKGDVGRLVDFFSIYENAPRPRPASPTLDGALPVNAAQHCMPIKTASSYGWHLYPPVDFALRWDGGVSTEFSILDGDGAPIQWVSLAAGRHVELPFVQEVKSRIKTAFPGDEERLDEAAFAFINANPYHNQIVEISLGIFAKTASGLSLLIRSPANLPSSKDYEVLEGIIETEWYRFCLPIVVKLTQQDRVVQFFRHAPIAMAQPIPSVLTRVGFSSTSLSYKSGLDELSQETWGEFMETRTRRGWATASGTYQKAVQQRKSKTNIDQS